MSRVRLMLSRLMLNDIGRDDGSPNEIRFVDELEDAIEEVSNAVLAGDAPDKAKGSVTAKIEIHAVEDSPNVIITGYITSKKTPKPIRKGIVATVQRDGKLTVEAFKQSNFDFEQDGSLPEIKTTILPVNYDEEQRKGPFGSPKSVLPSEIKEDQIKGDHQPTIERNDDGSFSEEGQRKMDEVLGKIDDMIANKKDTIIH